MPKAVSVRLSWCVMLSESGEGKEMAPEVNRREGKKLIFPSKMSLLH